MQMSTIRLPTPGPEKFVSPPLELHPTPVKRQKFRNMLIRGGGLIGHEEVKKIIAEREEQSQDGELLDLSDEADIAKLPTPNSVGKDFCVNELLVFDKSPLSPTSNMSASLLSNTSFEVNEQTASLLDLESSPDTSPSAAQENFSSMKLPVLSQSLEELQGLEFQEPAASHANSEITLIDPGNSRPPLEKIVSEDHRGEAIVFQGRHSRRNSQRKFTAVDPDLADQAFRIFSQEIKRHQPSNNPTRDVNT
jgi:hypothetical protein